MGFKSFYKLSKLCMGILLGIGSYHLQQPSSVSMMPKSFPGLLHGMKCACTSNVID